MFVVGIYRCERAARRSYNLLSAAMVTTAVRYNGSGRRAVTASRAAMVTCRGALQTAVLRYKRLFSELDGRPATVTCWSGCKVIAALALGSNP